MLVEGTTIFHSNLLQHEFFGEESTNKFSLQVILDKKTAATLAKSGIKIKDYEGDPLRKFTSKYKIKVFLAEGEPWNEEIPSGSKVKIEYITKKHATAGEVPYAQRVLIQEMGEGYEGTGDKAFFSDEPPY